MPSSFSPSTSSEGNYPVYEVLLGTGQYTSDNIDLYDQQWFTGITITDKLNQISSATLTFHNLQSKDLPDGCILKTATQDTLRDVEIRIYLGGRKKFAGMITRPEKAYQTGKIAVTCYGLAEYLHKKTIDQKKDFRNKLSSDLIKGYFAYPSPLPDPEDPDNNIPSGNWEFQFGYNNDSDNNDNDFKLNYRLETGNFLMHLNNICVTNFWDWYIEDVDGAGESGLSQRIIHIESERGRFRSVPTFRFDKDSYNANILRDKDKLKNVVRISGNSSQASNLETTAAGFFKMEDDDGNSVIGQNMGHLLCSESYLFRQLLQYAGTDDDPYKDDAKIVLEDGSGYPDTGKVQIDDEIIEYTTKEEVTYTTEQGVDLTLTELGGLTRGEDPENHDPWSPALNVAFLKAYIPAEVITSSQKLWIGNELISGIIKPDGIYASNSSTPIQRGLSSNGVDTPIYAHGEGTKIFNGDVSLTSPDMKSSISLYQRTDRKVSGIGVTDRDGLDKYGTSQLLAAQQYVSYGSHTITLDKLGDLQSGDYVNLQEYGEEDLIKKRCTGIVLSDDVAEIQFGLNEEWILNQFDDISKVEDKTFSKEDKSSKQEILEISSDGKSARVIDPTTNDDVWVPIV